MAQSFTSAQWTKIFNHMDANGEKLGLPKKRRGSVVLCSFNIRKLGAVKKKSKGSWEMFRRICDRCDLIAIQEVQDDLSGLLHLKELLGSGYGLVASDITGATPGSSSPKERLAFLFRWKRIERTEIASDITYDRSAVVGTLYDSRIEFWQSFDEHTQKFGAWEADAAERRAQGRRPKTKPVLHLPRFLTFIRQPLCVSFRIRGRRGKEPYEILMVNAHLLYGRYPDERKWEWQALIRWLVERGRQADKLYHPNLMLLGDCNLDFEKTEQRREEIDAFIKSLNAKFLSGKKHAQLNFPFLDVHPKHTDVFRTNARLSQTYDQIGLVNHDKRLPSHEANATAGARADAFDYGVFNFVDLFAEALHGGKKLAELTKTQRKTLFKKFEHDLTDHMPIWIRLPKP